MGPKQSIWVKAVQKRIAITSAVLRSIKTVKMTGLTNSMVRRLQNERIGELGLAKPFRWLIVVLNVLGKSIINDNYKKKSCGRYYKASTLEPQM
jgi:ATP-binding cassette subfamily C (CFTR/MRP) protein 1